MKRMIPVLIALLLIIFIGGGLFAKFYFDRYSYSMERADIKEYYGINDGEYAVIFGDERIDYVARMKGGEIYLPLDMIHEYLSEIFYEDENEGLLLYTDAYDTVAAGFDSEVFSDASGEQKAGYTICFKEGDVLYVASDYAAKYCGRTPAVYEYRIHYVTPDESGERATVAKKSAIRKLGGVKSPVLEDVDKGDNVRILERMEEWSKVITDDAMIGYIENKHLNESLTENLAEAVDTSTAPEYPSISYPGRINLSFHAIGGAGGNDTLLDELNNAPGVNIVVPTWVSLTDNEGNVRNFASSAYVNAAHAKGAQVWLCADDFNYRNETKTEIDEMYVLSHTSIRRNLVNNIISAAESSGADGINIDFESVTQEMGVHYVQFLRELSVACRSRSLILSVDNYVPMNFNDYYRLDIQGEILDYVIIMGYDEHGRWSNDAGSVAILDYVANGLDRTLLEVPKEKVINALPLYMMQWKTEGSDVSGQYITMNNLYELLGRLSATKEWDETTGQNYVEWTSGNALYQMWIEDEESISAKLNVMRAREIAGAGTWRLGYGIPNIWKLLEIYTNS